MTIAEIARRANVSESVAVKELSRVMGETLTPQSTIVLEMVGMAILLLAMS